MCTGSVLKPDYVHYLVDRALEFVTEWFGVLVFKWGAVRLQTVTRRH